MRVSMTICRQTLPSLLDFSMDKIGPNILSINPHHPKDKVVIIMGATGTGKSRLSIDIATRFPAEIINSDKIQVHQGLDILTNKITQEESQGIPHHLLGVLPPQADFTATDFREMANSSVESVLNKGKLPIIVGGSNSYVEALVDDKDFDFRRRYECCFLWVDVSMPILHGFVSERVDRMIEKGLVDEVRRVFDFSDSDYTRGIRKAIGVPEFDRFFRWERFVDANRREQFLRDAVEEVKKNTCALACRQREKIHQLSTIKKWKINRLDATSVFSRPQTQDTDDMAWERLVAGPGIDIVTRFLLTVSGLPGNDVAAAAVAAAVARQRKIERCLVA